MAKILVACEYSGAVRDAFRRRGHDAMSCDLLPSDVEGPHYAGDMFDLDLASFDLLVAFPPCTYLCGSGIHWNNRVPGRSEKTEAAVAFVERIAIENPVGILSTRIRKPDQIIQPYEYGHDASKKTCLWLKNLPKLAPGRYIAPRIVNGRQRWGNQTDSGQNKLGPSADRWKIRSETFQGIADAMAETWSPLLRSTGR